MRFDDLAARRGTTGLIFCALALSVEAGPPAATVPAASSAPADESALLAEQVEAYRKKHKLPALAAAVIRPRRAPLVSVTGRRKARSRHAAEAGDLFHIGSCTKSMTAVVCGTLIDEGKLGFKTTVAEALPALAGKLDPAFRAATLEQLLCHRAGLPDDRRPDMETFPKIRFMTGPLSDQRRQLVELVMGRPPTSPPGTKFAYSNHGFVVAAAMAEEAAGRSFEDLIRERLFKKLGMDSAGFGPPGDPRRVDQPWGHLSILGILQPQEPGPLADNPAVMMPGGCVHLSMADWAKYAAWRLSAAQGEVRLLSRATFERMAGDPYGQEYAFGWVVDERPWADGLVWMHDGSNSLWYAVIMVAPDVDLALLAATNVGHEDAQKACHDLVKDLRRPFETKRRNRRP